MKKVIFLILAVFMIAAGTSSCTRRYSEKSVSDKTSVSQKQAECCSAEISREHPKQYEKLVVRRVSQFITGRGYSSYSVPLVLLENGDVLSDRDNQMLYLLKPGDTVIFFAGEVVGYNLKDWLQRR